LLRLILKPKIPKPRRPCIFPTNSGEIPIERIEGKAKLNQNRTPADRSGVITALEESPEPGDHRLSAAMREIDG